jgi:predicted HicB family RNase H-like nuclease
VSNEYLLRDIPVDLHKELKIQAVREGITLKELMLKALEEYLKSVMKKGGK